MSVEVDGKLLDSADTVGGGVRVYFAFSVFHGFTFITGGGDADHLTFVKETRSSRVTPFSRLSPPEST